MATKEKLQVYLETVSIPHKEWKGNAISKCVSCFGMLEKGDNLHCKTCLAKLKR